MTQLAGSSKKLICDDEYKDPESDESIHHDVPYAGNNPSIQPAASSSEIDGNHGNDIDTADGAVDIRGACNLINIDLLDLRLAMTGFVAYMAFIGYLRATSVFRLDLINHLKISDTMAGVIDSLFVFGLALGSLSAGIIIPRFGIRRPTMICGFVGIFGYSVSAYSVSVGMIYLLLASTFLLTGYPVGVVINTAQRAIKDHATNEGFVICVMYMGATAGSVIFPNTFRALRTLQSYHLCYIYWSMAAFMTIFVICGYIMPESKSHNAEAIDSIKRDETMLEAEADPGLEVIRNEKITEERSALFSRKLLYNRDYMFLVVGSACYLGAENVTVLLFSPVLQGYSYTKGDVVQLMSVSGFIELTSKIASSLLIDRCNKIVTLITTFSITGLATGMFSLAFLLNSSIQYWTLYASTIIMFIAISWTGSFITACLIGLMRDSEYFSVATGFLTFMTAIAGSLWPLIANKAVDIVRGAGLDRPYNVGYWFSTASAVLSVLLLSPLRKKIL